MAKDLFLEAYLQNIRDLNKKRTSICKYCKKQSTGINANGYKIEYVCDDHLRREADVILDTTIPGVIHYTYPNGKRVPEHMMDPNVGGFKKDSNIVQ